MRTGGATARQGLRLFFIAGEHSGDALGGKLMAALNRLCKGQVHYLGVGGENMEREGLASQFPLSDVAVMGSLSILPRLPRIVSRVHRTVDAAVAAEPDAVVIIDAPGVHARHRQAHPQADARRCLLSITSAPVCGRGVPGARARCTAYVDHVLALLPFEPSALERLGGPASTYVGHPLVERLDWLHGLDPAPLAQRLNLDPHRPVLVVLPGSRTSEVGRLMEPFGGAIDELCERGMDVQVIIPVVPHVRPLVEARLRSWKTKPHLIEGEEDKFRAFKLARAALAASGTVTLELALAGTPMVVAYCVDALAVRLRFMLKVPSIVLANLVLGENAFPECLQERCTPEILSSTIELLIKDTAERRAQLAALARIPERMALTRGTPSEAAADVVLHFAEHARRQPY